MLGAGMSKNSIESVSMPDAIATEAAGCVGRNNHVDMAACNDG